MSYFIPIDNEEQLTVVLALYILKLLGEPKPKKAKVLRFIKKRGLVRFYDGDAELRSNGEEKWMNDFSWAREDAKERTLLTMPEFGIWQLTDHGRDWLLQKARAWGEIYEKNPESKVGFLGRCRRLNETFFTHMIMLGKGEDISMTKNCHPFL